MRSEKARFFDVLDAIEQIETLEAGTLEEFLGNRVVQVWMLHHVQIIGEAMRAICPDTRAHFPEIDWSRIVGMRHVLVHDYFDIEYRTLWETIREDVPTLKAQVERVLEVLGSAPDDV